MGPPQGCGGEGVVDLTAALAAVALHRGAIPAVDVGVAAAAARAGHGGGRGQTWFAVFSGGSRVVKKTANQV
jgi:hypothetical protein